MKTPKGTNYLFAIAIDKYKNVPQLSNCVRDAKDFITVLQNRYVFQQENILTLFDEQATLSQINEKLDELSRNIKDEDNVIIYFSGHGYYKDSQKEGYLIPVDGADGSYWSYLSNSNFLSHIRAIKSFHTFLIVDSCFSGSLFASKDGSSSSYAEKAGNYPSRWGLAAGMIEKVSDGFHGENSPFAKAIITFLKKSKEQKSPVSDLIQFVKKATANNAEQTPIGGPLFKVGDLNGEFVFELQRNEAADWKEAKTLGTVPAYEDFLNNHPNGEFASEAQKEIKKVKAEQAWENILKMPDEKEYEIHQKTLAIHQYLKDFKQAENMLEVEKTGADLHFKKEFLSIQNNPYALKTFARRNTPFKEVAQQRIVELETIAEEEARAAEKATAEKEAAERKAAEEQKLKDAERQKRQELLNKRLEQERVDAEKRKIAEANKKAEALRIAQERQQTEKRNAEEALKKKQAADARQKELARKRQAAARKKDQERLAEQERIKAERQKTRGKTNHSKSSFFTKKHKYAITGLLAVIVLFVMIKLIAEAYQQSVNDSRLVRFVDTQTQLYGYKKSGKIVIPAIYNKGDDFKNGEASVISKEGHIFIINEKGNCIRDCPTKNISIGTPLDAYKVAIANANAAMDQKPPDLKLAQSEFQRALTLAEQYKFDLTHLRKGMDKLQGLIDKQSEGLKKLEGENKPKEETSKENAFEKPKYEPAASIKKLAEKKTGRFSDSRDNQIYKWVELKDGKKWMAENLNFLSSNSYCFNNEDKNCDKYGRLYTYDAALKACPKGWRLPGEKDWNELIKAYGGSKSAARAFMKTGDSGLTLQLGGNTILEGKGLGLGEYGDYWTADNDDSFASVYFTFDTKDMARRSYSRKMGRACRCIQD